MRIFLPILFTATLSAQTLSAQECPNLCNYDFWRSATVETVQAAIDAGENVNAVDEYGSPVFDSVLSFSTVDYLLYYPDGDIVAEQNRLDSLIMLMVAAGVDLTTHEQANLPYLHRATINSSTMIVQLLIDSGASVTELDSEQSTALHSAVQGGNIATIELLIQAGININAKNEDGETPLHAATSHTIQGAADTMLWLFEHGADVNVQESRFDKTPIMSFFFWGNESRAADSFIVLQAAIAAGYDITISDHVGNTMLHYAAWVGKSPAAIQYLVDQGADTSLTNDEGKTAYDLALENYALAETEIITSLK